MRRSPRLQARKFCQISRIVIRGLLYAISGGGGPALFKEPSANLPSPIAGHVVALEPGGERFGGNVEYVFHRLIPQGGGPYWRRMLSLDNLNGYASSWGFPSSQSLGAALPKDGDEFELHESCQCILDCDLLKIPWMAPVC